MIVFGDGGFDILKRFIGVGVGPPRIAIGEKFARGCGDKYALVNAIWIVSKNLSCDTMFPNLFVRVFVVADVICSDRNHVLCYIVSDIGASPDELPGLGAILSTMSARVAEVEPEENGFIGLVSVD